MARNRERANLMFNRWTSLKSELATGDGKKERRPFLASEVTNVSDAERWRRDVIREISKKVADIQNAGLGEPRIRDLNDEINKLLREKGHWERQIKALGGPDYRVSAPRMFEEDGKLVPGGGSYGYRYFGAAKDLPGVRELFAEAAAEKAARTRGDIVKHLTPDYYGFRDDEDGVLVEAEAAAEAQWKADGVLDWAKSRGIPLPEGTDAVAVAAAVSAAVVVAGGVGGSAEDDDVEVPALAPLAPPAAMGGSGGDPAASVLTSGDNGAIAVSQVEAMLAQRKRELLMAQYATLELQAAMATSSGGAV